MEDKHNDQFPLFTLHDYLDCHEVFKLNDHDFYCNGCGAILTDVYCEKLIPLHYTSYDARPLMNKYPSDVLSKARDISLWWWTYLAYKQRA
jgi:hypothetical protein